MSDYKRIVEQDFDQAVAKVRETLAKQGFGVLTEIDVKATLKKKIDVDFRRYLILGACNPGFAHQALEFDLGIGTLLPCNVIAYEDDAGKTVLQAVDPAQLLPSEDPKMIEVAAEVGKRLAAAIAEV